MVNSSDKEEATRELLRQKKSYSEIEQQLSVSSRDISHTKKRYEERKKVEEEQNKIQISKTSQALKLFEQANTSVQVAIELDLEPDETDILYKVYCRMNGRTKLNEIYDKLGDKLFVFIGLYEHIEKEGMGIRQVVNLFKIAEEIPNLEARYQRIKDDIDLDEPRILNLIKQKVSLSEELTSMREEIQSFREYENNQLKSMQEELASAREQSNIELNKQKESLAHEPDKYKASLTIELKSLQIDIDNLKQEEQRLTTSVERLTNEELEILKRRKQQEPYIQPQLGYQERPILSEEEQRILAIPIICNNWESKWGELMSRGL
ncbi:MAG: hypothetical protein DLM72_06995 [Candidatus Nitrosopolaris wilkensis]|nr:MAG: hypothetical protein DLM72_06995 [Candidatus Nitrosopolaris wilkensis]